MKSRARIALDEDVAIRSASASKHLPRILGSALQSSAPITQFSDVLAATLQSAPTVIPSGFPHTSLLQHQHSRVHHEPEFCDPVEG